MSVNYKYFTDDKPILITEETKKLTPYTWLDDNKLFDEVVIKFFYDECLKIKNPVVIDIGAQTGLFSLLAKYLPTSIFYAFEPFNPCLKCLNDNLLLNGITNVETYQIALSDKIGKSILKVPTHKGLSTLANKPMRFKKFREIQVNVNTLDNLFYDKVDKIDLIKIDTEGWEYFILKGGVNMIKKYKPKILLEVHDKNMKQCNVNRQQFMKFIDEDLNYRIKKKFREDYYIIPK